MTQFQFDILIVFSGALGQNHNARRKDKIGLEVYQDQVSSAIVKDHSISKTSRYYFRDESGALSGENVNLTLSW